MSKIPEYDESIEVNKDDVFEGLTSREATDGEEDKILYNCRNLNRFQSLKGFLIAVAGVVMTVVFWIIDRPESFIDWIQTGLYFYLEVGMVITGIAMMFLSRSDQKEIKNKNYSIYTLKGMLQKKTMKKKDLTHHFWFIKHDSGLIFFEDFLQEEKDLVEGKKYIFDISRITDNRVFVLKMKSV